MEVDASPNCIAIGVRLQSRSAPVNPDKSGAAACGSVRHQLMSWLPTDSPTTATNPITNKSIARRVNFEPRLGVGEGGVMTKRHQKERHDQRAKDDRTSTRYRPTPTGEGGHGQVVIGGQTQRIRSAGREQPSEPRVPMNCCRSP